MSDYLVRPRLGSRCPRCGMPHWNIDTTVCEACWVDLGQLSFWEDADDDDAEVEVEWDRDAPTES